MGRKSNGALRQINGRNTTGEDRQAQKIKRAEKMFKKTVKGK